MKAKIDFALSRRMGVVSQAIFRLVLCGISDIKVIADLLRIYSDEVLANAIRNLINKQLLIVDVEMDSIWLSDPIIALIQRCHDNEFNIELPESIMADMDGNRLIISGDDGSLEEWESYQDIKRGMLSLLLPGATIGFLAKTLDFIIIVED